MIAPVFSMMMDDLRHGVINCILVKDLSRFGRDYVQTGEYIEKNISFYGERGSYPSSKISITSGRMPEIR